MNKPAQNPDGVDIEILDRGAGDQRGLLPDTVRINGITVPIPAGTTIKVHDITDDSLVTVTLTLFARSISIRHEPT